MDKEIAATAFLGMGSDLGERRKNLLSALALLEEKAGRITASSALYETEPWGFTTDSVFLNMVVRIETMLEPSALLDTLLGIEKAMGRVREKKAYTSRIIDLDILFYNDLILENHKLVVPHPLIQDRRFVLVPLSEIAPDYIHPLLNKSISSLLSACADTSKVVKL